MPPISPMLAPAAGPDAPGRHRLDGIAYTVRMAQGLPALEGDHEAIGPTGHYTAYVWHRLGLPYAELFKTRKGAALYWGGRAAGEWLTEFSRRMPAMWQYLGHRHLLIEARLATLQPDLIVELGAGLSRRGVTWAVDRGVRYIEIDLPHMIEAKRRRLHRAPPRVQAVLGERLTLTARNILDANFAGELGGMLRRAERPAVIAEGVLMYFPFADRERLLDAIARGLRSAGGGEFLCDLQTRDREHEAGAAPDLLRRGIKVVTGGRGVAEPWEDWPHVERFFAARGFDAVSRLEASDHLEQEPRLAKMRSPGSLVCAKVGSDQKPE